MYIVLPTWVSPDSALWIFWLAMLPVATMAFKSRKTLFKWLKTRRNPAVAQTALILIVQMFAAVILTVLLSLSIYTVKYDSQSGKPVIEERAALGIKAGRDRLLVNNINDTIVAEIPVDKHVEKRRDPLLGRLPDIVTAGGHTPVLVAPGDQIEIPALARPALTETYNAHYYRPQDYTTWIYFSVGEYRGEMESEATPVVNDVIEDILKKNFQDN